MGINAKIYSMNTTFYELTGTTELEIALVADLHECNPKEIITSLQEISPDCILVAGDVLERHSEGEDPRYTLKKITMGPLALAKSNIKHLIYLFARLFLGKNTSGGHEDLAYDFFRQASQIAPVFYSLGNHEWFLREKDKEILKKYNIRLLNNSDVLWNDILIGGLSPAPDLEWLDNFSKKDGYKILLCHHPEYYEQHLFDKNIDLVLSGHAHGGQIRLFNHGIFSTGQGFFPRLTKGLYFDDKLVVTTGCANTANFPRINNPCEVVALTIKPS